MSKPLPLQATENRAFIKYDESPEPNEVGGILLPENFDRSGKGVLLYTEAEVISAGPLCTQIKVGDHILIAKSNIERVKFGEHHYNLIVERSVTGIIPSSITGYIP